MMLRLLCACGLVGICLSVAAQDVPPPLKFPAPPAGTPVGGDPAGKGETPGRGVAAGQGDAGVATLKISTRIVVLDVVVTDKKGNVVRGLKKDDFAITEDGTAQTIRSFDGPEAHTMPAGVEVKSAADLKKIGDAPVTVLVLDALNTRFEDVAFVRQALEKYLRAQPAVLPQPMVLLMATDTRFRQLHDYTQDRDALIEAVRKAPAELTSKRNQGRNGPVAVERMAQSLASLEQIAQASEGTPGKKNVIWVGEGFPSADLVGLDPVTGATIEAAVKQCVDMLQAARVTMYTINPVANTTVTVDAQSAEDLAGQDTGGPEFAEGAVQFESFAPATGGKAFRSRNDLGNEVAEGIAQGTFYYTLSYAPTNRTDDLAKYRKIRVKTTNPDYVVTTRDGYYPVADSVAVGNVGTTEAPKQAHAQLELDISSAVNSAISYNGLEVKATRVGTNYVLQVRGAGLTWQTVNDGKERTEVTALAAWFDAKDKLLGHAGKELTASRTAPADALQQGSAAFVLPVSWPASSVARVRFVVRDAVSGKMGTVDVVP